MKDDNNSRFSASDYSPRPQLRKNGRKNVSLSSPVSPPMEQTPTSNQGVTENWGGVNKTATTTSHDTIFSTDINLIIVSDEDLVKIIKTLKIKSHRAIHDNVNSNTSKEVRDLEIQGLAHFL